MNFYHWNIAAPWYSVALMFMPSYWGLAQIFVPRLRIQGWTAMPSKLLVIFWTLGGALLLLHWSAEANVADYFNAQTLEVSRVTALSPRTSGPRHRP